ncbi:cell division protein FtsQ/DivIB [Pedomonas mirosovicensis]|uniref:cell division protein FtsQ/DivIB n=1 Tax=Pedomonas mirosovicensis TaxID=2908641 RepID=UPI002167AAB8|nr:FtsQ-type POTRA domain-containing protein [Pedomonas mirosovicensis]MCH8684673.1 FtsQ-type POTRA domain-containing protein [Pedomonas mirosovicensis]
MSKRSSKSKKQQTGALWRSLRRGLMLAGGLAAAGAVAGLCLWYFDVPQRLKFSLAQGVASLGFEVTTLHVTGLKHAPRLAVYSAVLDGRTNSMLTIDLDDVRARLLENPWIQEVSVSRRLPDTLNIVVQERKPVALWQTQGRLSVIDVYGRVLETERLKQFAKLPIVVGAEANQHAMSLFSLLSIHPELRSRMDAATWIGGRRWDLRFRSGELLMLPEGEEASRKALERFSVMERNTGLLGRGFARFDMRQEDRLYTRRAATMKNSSDTRSVRAEVAAQGVDI